MGSQVFYESMSELARLTNTFTVAGTPTDPTTVTLTVTSPSGTAASYTYAAAEVEKVSTGVYRKDVTCSEAGEWSYKWVGTGSATDTEAGSFTVYEATLGKLYATPAALKSRLSIADTADDYEIHAACFAASRAIEQHCCRVFYRSASGTVRTVVPEDAYTLILPDFCDLVTLTALATDEDGDGTFETSWVASDYQLGPINPSAGPEQKPYTRVDAVGTLLFPLATARGQRRDRVQLYWCCGLE
jgi:hypothetical protein